MWQEPGMFEQVRINDEGALEWPGEIDLCADALYLRTTGKKPEELFPSLQHRFDTCLSSLAFLASSSACITAITRHPHFHASYAGETAMIDIETLSVIAGKLPARALGLALEWATIIRTNFARRFNERRNWRCRKRLHR